MSSTSTSSSSMNSSSICVAHGTFYLNGILVTPNFVTPTTLPHTHTQHFHTHRVVTHDSFTRNIATHNTTLSPATLSHTTLSHRALSATTLSHNSFTHSTCNIATHNSFTQNSVFHTQHFRTTLPRTQLHTQLFYTHTHTTLSLTHTCHPSPRNILTQTQARITLSHTQHCHTHNSVTHTHTRTFFACNSFTVFTHTDTHTQNSVSRHSFHTHLFHTDLSHTQLCHAQLCHTQLCHTQLFHTICLPPCSFSFFDFLSHFHIWLVVIVSPWFWERICRVKVEMVPMRPFTGGQANNWTNGVMAALWGVVVAEVTLTKEQKARQALTKASLNRMVRGLWQLWRGPRWRRNSCLELFPLLFPRSWAFPIGQLQQSWRMPSRAGLQRCTRTAQQVTQNLSRIWSRLSRP